MSRITKFCDFDKADAAELLETIVGELQIVDRKLNAISGKIDPLELLLVRRFVAMATKQATHIFTQTVQEPRSPDARHLPSVPAD